MIDSEGYRLNVGIILCNEQGRLFWARRIGQRSWQFPQGGIQRDESPEQAMFRELAEEVGLRPEHVEIIGCTKGWLRYRLPRHLIRQGGKSACIGQKQVWFLLRMLGEEDAVRLDLSDRPEFDHWEWVDYWYPLRAVVAFKRQVYLRALRELAPLLAPGYPLKKSVRAKVFSTDARGLAEEKSRRREISASVLRARADLTVRLPASPKDPGHSDRVCVRDPQPVILPLRRMETVQHPVITRMVVSIRRLEAVVSIPEAALKPATAIASLEKSIRPPHSTAPGSQR